MILSVFDQGIGISESDREKLFTPFFKSVDEKSKSMNKQSHGIGLYLCRRIAESLGGSLDYIPRSYGSQFDLTLRLSYVDSPAKVSPLF